MVFLILIFVCWIELRYLFRFCWFCVDRVFCKLWVFLSKVLSVFWFRVRWWVEFVVFLMNNMLKMCLGWCFVGIVWLWWLNESVWVLWVVLILLLVDMISDVMWVLFFICFIYFWLSEMVLEYLVFLLFVVVFVRNWFVLLWLWMFWDCGCEKLESIVNLFFRDFSGVM